ncbi:uncharacterized protein BDW47DRAFT_111389 [Aspergillus candidus]|uniref:Chalcone isomerase cfoK n=1 Tax=Aspergillus candidus TaxID=41067 RepID=CFOK_ASPCN|nr:hypothetical protein BDW47DRAFT_111389 [Aspergillus candidus]A0A2I2F2J6.1 RecName: Full=Chalcone isomerase cfoK; Short=CHI cfoK; AltName: Full=Chlorflavonin biosynthesis cluster protein K [Aspergillus candidus]PLB34862.1 hypothetical protein BDW47DRAFT_111389 [Aspergillus candidus]
MSNNSKIIQMCVAGQRKKGWSDEQFAHEFTVVHAEITKATAEKAPALLGYRQVLAIPRPRISAFNMNNSTWDSQAVLTWSSIEELSSLLKSEGYRANAGNHVFTEPDIVGSISQVAGEFVFDPVGYSSQESRFMVFVYIPRATRSSRELVTEQEVAQRLDNITKIGAGTGLLRYVINRDVTPSDPSQLFDGTPFTNGDWGVMGVTEQYWFKDEDTASAFFADEARVDALMKVPSSLDGKSCVAVAGQETVLVSK